jgi:hypothetical protein
LRIIDINDDGKINHEEFKFFIELFSGREPSQGTLNLLKKAHENENKVNYFGEKPNINPLKYEESRAQRLQNSSEKSRTHKTITSKSKSNYRRDGPGGAKDIKTSHPLLNDGTTNLGTSFGPLKPESYSKSRETTSHPSHPSDQGRSTGERSEFRERSYKSRTGRSGYGGSTKPKSKYESSFKRSGGDYSRGERSNYDRSEKASVRQFC